MAAKKQAILSTLIMFTLFKSLIHLTLLQLRGLRDAYQLSVKILVTLEKVFKYLYLRPSGFVTKNSKVSRSKATTRESFCSQVRTTQGQQEIRPWLNSVPTICLP